MFFFVYSFSRTFELENDEVSKIPVDVGNEESIVLAKIIRPPKPGERTVKAVMKILDLPGDSLTLSLKGLKIAASIETDSLTRSLEYGDLLVFSARVKKPAPPPNPGGFDYSSYLSSHRIYLKTYIPSNSWGKVSENAGNVFMAYIYQLRREFIDKLEQNGLEGRELALASAILLGSKDLLDEEMTTAFSHAGAMHILCVSGLHVGIVYLVLVSLLGLLRRNPRGAMVSSLISLAGIWCFAILTGMAPSVMRASLMLSFIIAGKSLRRQTDIYNSLAASALIILVIDPEILYYTGFQLSYLAVLGIVTFQKGFEGMWDPASRFLAKAWELVKVSVSAQIATFPLACFLFHQFPLYFILTNLVAVPLSSFVIYTGMLAEASIFSDLIPHIFIFLFRWLLHFFNLFVLWVDSLPGSYIDQINISFPEMILLYFGIISFYSWIKKKSLKSYLLLISLMIIVAGQFMFRHYQEQMQKGIICYSRIGHTAIDIIEGRSSWLFCDTLLRDDSLFAKYTLEPARLYYGVIQTHQLDILCDNNDPDILQKQGDLIIYKGKSIFILGRNTTLFETLNKPKVDYLLISGSPYYTLEEILKSIHPYRVIVDASNYSSKAMELKKECLEAGIPFHNTVESGAFAEFW